MSVTVITTGKEYEERDKFVMVLHDLVLNNEDAQKKPSIQMKCINGTV